MKPALARKRFGEDITPWREFDLATNRFRDMMLEPLFPEGFFRMPYWAEREAWMPAVELVENDPERADSSSQHRGERNVEQEPLLGEQSTGTPGLLDTSIGEIHVLPAGETILPIPRALTVAQ